MARSLADDLSFCRVILPRVSRTFAINIRLLNGILGDSVRTAYLLCRIADALEDSWPGRAEELGARFDLMLAAMGGLEEAAEALAREALPMAGDRDDLGLVSHFPRVWRVWRALPAEHAAVVSECVCVLARGMRRYSTRAATNPPRSSYIDTEAELHDYCWVVAGCVGVMLTRLFALEHPRARPEAEQRRLELAPAVGEALQLTNILLDWPADVRRGRCHVPASWLAESGIEARDLVGADRREVRDLARRLEALARGALARVPEYVALIPAHHLRYRLFCLWPALWAEASLRHARTDPQFPWGPSRPRLPKRDLWVAAVRALAVGRSAAVLAR